MGFRPAWDGWRLEPVAVSTNDPAEPNICAVRLRGRDRTLLARLVHGYNMPMCMKMKDYTTELVAERGIGAGGREPETLDHGPQT